MEYEITPLSKELLYIRWTASPEIGSPTENQFLEDLTILLNNAKQPIYFLSDLRKGRISNMQTLWQLAQLAQHENWGGGTAFGNDPITNLLAQAFARFVRRANRQDEIWHTREQALAFLETLKPGITRGIDWSTIP